MQPRNSVYDLAHGRWPGILAHFGLTDKQLSGKHTCCPIPGCGGKDRFRFRDREGTGDWFCSACKSGNGMDLLMKVRGWTFAEAAREVEAICGKVEYREPRAVMTDEEKCRSLRRVWLEAKPMSIGDEGWKYLIGRGLTMAEVPRELRVHPGLPYLDQDGKVVGRYPAILARVTGPGGEGRTIHRTFIQNGQKAPVEEPKKLMPGKAMAGAAVRLSPAAEHIGIAEGLETSLAASRLFALPVWQAVSTAGMEAFIPPDGVRRVTIFADHDENFAGHKAAYVLAHRLALKGCQVDVQIPPAPGDWLDHYNLMVKKLALVPEYLEAE